MLLASGQLCNNELLLDNKPELTGATAGSLPIMNDRPTTSHHVRTEADDAALTRESWKVFQIMAEFVEGFQKLAGIRPSVSMFGSARLQPHLPLRRILPDVCPTPVSRWSAAAGRV